MFCGCELSFGEQPNIHTCPGCLGLPGTLPVINERAVHFGLMIGLALGCEIAPRSHVSPQELLLSRPPKGLPDLPVRRAALQRRTTWRCPHPPRSSRGGCREARPCFRQRTDPRLRHQRGRLQSRRHAAGGDRHRARSALRRARPGMAEPAALDAAGARRLGRQHGGGVAALRRQRVGSPGRLDRARNEDRAEEHELVPLPRARRARGDRAPDRAAASRRGGRAGDAPLRPARPVS